MRDEIQSGIRNAVERGSSLEEAIQSFISAGYNPVEVKEAANNMGSSLTPIIQQNKSRAATSAVQNMNNMNNMNNNQQNTAPKNLFTLSNPMPFGQQTQETKQKVIENSQIQVQSKSYSSTELIPRKNPKKRLMIILIVILLFLIASLAAVMLFANDLLKGLFG